MENSNFKNLKVIKAWDEGNDIHLVTKVNGKRGIKVIKDFQWYFGVKESDWNKPLVQGIIEQYFKFNIVKGYDFVEKGYVRVYVDKTFKYTDLEGRTGIRRSARDFFVELKKAGVTTFESDLSYWKRFITDNAIEVEGDLDLLYFDIETDDSNGGIVIGRDRILSWAAANNKGEVFYDTGEEKDILKSLINCIHKHDVICGWNSNNFDLPYIQARMMYHGLEYDWRKKIHLDLLTRCARIYSYNMFNIGLKGFSLNEVARVFLGEKKVEHTQSIKEMFEHNKELLKEYNIKDVTLLRDLDAKLLITDLMIKECQWTGAFLDRFFIGELLDNYILRRTKELGFFQYARPDQEEKKGFENTDIRGGYVMTPITGLYNNVRVCDFKSLYPSIIVGFNIGRDSLNNDLSDAGYVAMCDFLQARQKGERKIEDTPFEEWWDFLKAEKKRLDPNDENIQAANNTYFRRDKVSFIGALVQNFLNKRAEWKAQAKGMPKDSPEYVSIQQSQGMVKEMANSMYGITGDKSSRYFDKHVAEAITLTGQFMNRVSTYFAKQRGFQTIYGDTDSIFIPVEKDEDMDKLIKDVNADLADYLVNDVKVHTNIVELQYEKTFGKLIMLDKKRYTGKMVMYDGNVENKLFTRGLENVKNNTIPMARRAMVDIIEQIVNDNVSRENAIIWLEKLKTHVMTSDIPVDEILIMTRISKSPDKYESKQLHVRLAERLIASGDMLPVDDNAKGWGTRMYYYVDTDPVTGKQEGFVKEQFHGTWDRNYYWDIQMYAPIRRVLETVWPDYEWDIYSIGDSERLARRKEREAKKILREQEEAAKKIARLDKKAQRDIEKQKLLDERAARKAAIAAKKSSAPVQLPLGLS